MNSNLKIWEKEKYAQYGKRSRGPMRRRKHVFIKACIPMHNRMLVELKLCKNLHYYIYAAQAHVCEECLNA